jgi:hypothetical protein
MRLRGYSHDSVAGERLNRAQATFEVAFYGPLTSRLFQRPRENFCLSFGGHHQNTVQVSEENVSGPDAHIPNLYRNPKIMDLVARS